MMTQLATATDVAAAQAWMVARGLPEIPADVFSSTGYVVPGIAAVWLYLTDSSVSFLELLVSNPSAPKLERRAALDAVVARAIDEAAQAGTRVLATNVIRADVEQLAKDHNFEQQAVVRMMTLTLRKERS